LIHGAKRLEVRGGSHYLLYERHSLTRALLGVFLQNCEKSQISRGARAQSQ
jgi:hypothetical protein